MEVVFVVPVELDVLLLELVVVDEVVLLFEEEPSCAVEDVVLSEVEVFEEDILRLAVLSSL